MSKNESIGELVKSICSELVLYPNDLSIKVVDQEDSTIVEIRAHESDMGKIIGKQGRIAKAIRTVVKAAAMKNNNKVYVEIIE